jgi:hypothetical protein
VVVVWLNFERKTAPSRLDCRYQRFDAYDVHDPGEIVSKHTQSHLGFDVLQSLHQEVGRAQAHLDSAEWMLDGLPAHV